MDRGRLRQLYDTTRRATEQLCAPLAVEDCVVQSMPDASPTKWHLAHTSWFFETFVLAPGLRGYRPLDARYAFLFNSYYEAAGERHPRPRRGLLSRPTVAEVFAYRRHVDDAMARWFDGSAGGDDGDARVLLGIHHEEQHQELIVTDVKHVLAMNPLRPRYAPAAPAAAAVPAPNAAPGRRFRRYDGGLVDVGAGDEGFAFDNERPRHRVYLQPFDLAERLVTCGEWRAFIADGGYRRPELWLSDGWDAVQREGWTAPLYWSEVDPGHEVVTLGGARPVDDAEPVCHVSYYEADAFARWVGARLPLEAEWEVAAGAAVVADGGGAAPRGHFADAGVFHPQAAPAADDRAAPHPQLFGDVWQWTASAYAPYPGFRPLAGALGEYNGKFMSNRMVLRGASCATPAGHARVSYRNFFAPESRWQFSGVRLAL